MEEKPKASEVVPPDESKPNIRQASDKAEKSGRISGLIESMIVEASSRGNPLYGKMTEEHISTILEIAKNHDERQYNLLNQQQGIDSRDRKSERLYLFLSFFVMVSLVVVVLIVFQDKPEILVPSLTGIGGLAGGFLGGWGFGKGRRSED